MDSTGRRDSLLRLLRRQSPCNVEDLADELQVSRGRFCAISRHSVSAASHPWRRRPGGAFSSTRVGPALLPASDDEVVSLVLSVAVMRAAPWIPFAAGAERALAKIEEHCGERVRSFGT